MRVWTNGSFARVWVKDTIFRLRDGSVSFEEKIKPMKGARDEAPDEIVAWSVTGVRLDPGLEKKRRRVVDARALDEERVIGIIKEGRGAARLVVGPPEGPYELEVALVATPERAEWPEGLLEGSVEWSDLDMYSGSPIRGIRVRQNRHGIGIAASASGHVAVLRPGASEPSFVFRLPGHEEARVDATPTREGVLVSFAHDAGGAVLHFDEAGKLLGRWPEGEFGGCLPAICLDDDKVLAFNRAAEALALLSLPDLDELSREDISEPLIDAAATSKGATVVLADMSIAYEVHVEGESLSIDGPFELTATEPEKPDATSRYKPAHASGPTQIAFPTERQAADPPWECDRDAEFKIPMRVRSAADAGKGVRVELAGAAVEKALIRGTIVVVGRHRAEFVSEGKMLVAVLPEVELPVGLEWPLDPKPKNDEEKAQARLLGAKAHFTVEIVVSGAQAGNGLLSIAIGALSTSSAPLKRMRPITVR